MRKLMEKMASDKPKKKAAKKKAAPKKKKEKKVDADVNKDGKVDEKDVNLVAKAVKTVKKKIVKKED